MSNKVKSIENRHTLIVDPKGQIETLGNFLSHDLIVKPRTRFNRNQIL